MKVYPPGEVAYFLRQALGPMREWSDCLADMRRGKTNVAGLQLLPVCRERALRPLYAAESIREFVKQVQCRCPEIETGAPLRGIEVEIELDDELPWRLRKLPSAAKH